MSSVLGLWSQSEGLWNPGVVADQMKDKFETLYERLEKRPSQEETKIVDSMFQSVISRTNADTIKTMSLIMVVFESLTLFAAYLMWNLDKRGFYLYLGALALAIVAPLLAVGGMLGLIMVLAGTFSTIIMSIFYAVNLKYMH